MIQTNIFTCCNGIYKNFIPIFILSNLYHNEDSFVEVCMDSSTDNEIKNSLSILKKYYNGRFLIRKITFKNIKKGTRTFSTIPNTYRFITVPQKKLPYVYISDIDIICLEKDISKIHIKNMEKNNLPYSNIVRPKIEDSQTYRRMSGLHFTKYEAFYPLPDYNDLVLNGMLNHDEVFLYELVKKRFPNFIEGETFRPVHGIHVSPNREHDGKMNWGLPRWKKEWVSFRSSEIFKEIEPTFTDYIKDKLNIIDNYYLNENNSL